MKQHHVILVIFIIVLCLTHAILLSAPPVKPSIPSTGPSATPAAKPSASAVPAISPSTETPTETPAAAPTAPQVSPEDLKWDNGEAPKPPMGLGPKGPRPGDQPGPRNRDFRNDFDSRGPRDHGPGEEEAMNRPEPMAPSFGGPGRKSREHDFDNRPSEGPQQPDQNPPFGPPQRGLFRDWDKLQKADPEMYELLRQDSDLEYRTRMLTMQYRQADGSSRENLGKELEENIKAHFTVRQKRRALELSRLEEELKRLKELFEKREKAADQIIQQRTQELKGETESLF